MEFRLVITSTLALKQINHHQLCWINQSSKVSLVFNMFAYVWSCKNCSHYRINVHIVFYSIFLFRISLPAPTASSRGVNVPPTYIGCFWGLMSLNNQNIIDNLTHWVTKYFIRVRKSERETGIYRDATHL